MIRFQLSHANILSLIEIFLTYLKRIYENIRSGWKIQNKVLMLYRNPSSQSILRFIIIIIVLTLMVVNFLPVITTENTKLDNSIIQYWFHIIIKKTLEFWRQINKSGMGLC